MNVDKMLDYGLHLENLCRQYRKQRKPLNINFREIVKIGNFDRLTHYIHSYPAKLLQCIPVYFINNSFLSSKNDVVYDPFCGSGTVAIEALNSHKKAVVRDINPFATFLTKVKCTYIHQDNLAKELLKIEKRLSKYTAQNHNIINRNYWYHPDIYNELSKLLQSILNVKDENIRNFFKICFSSTTKKMSYADPRINVPVRLRPEKYPVGHKYRLAAERKLAELMPASVITTFKSNVYANTKRLVSVQDFCLDDLYVETVNAYNPPSTRHEKKIDLIITSPPYPGAQKYIRASSQSLAWLDMHTGCLTPLKKQIIGREEISKSEYIGETHCLSADKQIKKIATQNIERAAIAESYLLEMRKVFISCRQSLKKNGYLVLIVANNLFCGVEFFTQKYLCEIASDEGFSIELELIDDIKSYGLMTKRNKTAGIISREIVTVFRKT